MLFYVWEFLKSLHIFFESAESPNGGGASPNGGGAFLQGMEQDPFFLAAR